MSDSVTPIYVVYVKSIEADTKCIGFSLVSAVFFCPFSLHHRWSLFFYLSLCVVGAVHVTQPKYIIYVYVLNTDTKEANNHIMREFTSVSNRKECPTTVAGTSAQPTRTHTRVSEQKKNIFQPTIFSPQGQYFNLIS